MLYCTEVIIFGGEVNFNSGQIVCLPLSVSPLIHILTTSGKFNVICFFLSTVAGRKLSK